MIRTSFPDLQWLKKYIDSRLAAKEGWPNVIINAKGVRDYRPDIKGTLSLFMNIRGESRCGVGNQLALINEDYFYISNQYQPYTLAIENAYTETFNIHFSEKLLSEVFAGLVLSDETLLDNHAQLNCSPVEFYNRLYPKDQAFQVLFADLYTYTRQEWQEPILLEEKLTNVMVYLLKLHKHIGQEVNKLAPIKKSTRIEVYKRLCVSLDYLHSCYTNEISLDDLAGMACLSKFHYLRLFKSVFHLSPHQYLLQLRLDKARNYLLHTQMQVNQISTLLGFQNITSFSRLFHQRYYMAPLHYRFKHSPQKLAILVN